MSIFDRFAGRADAARRGWVFSSTQAAEPVRLDVMEPRLLMAATPDAIADALDLPAGTVIIYTGDFGVAAVNLHLAKALDDKFTFPGSLEVPPGRPGHPHRRRRQDRRGLTLFTASQPTPSPACTCGAFSP